MVASVAIWGEPRWCNVLAELCRLLGVAWSLPEPAAHDMGGSQRTWFAATLVAAFGIHAVAFLIVSPGDAFVYVIPWYHHLIEHGIGEPIGNYSPPYLYLLRAMAVFHGLVWDVVLVKLLSILGAVWLCFCAARLMKVLGRDPKLGLLVLALPSVILNTSALGQADTFWVAPCLLSVAAAIERKPARTAAWAGFAFAVKQQAAWLAPFVIYYLIINRAKPHVWLAAPLAFVLAWLPAWLSGWPLFDLLMTYPDQATTIPRKGPFTENGASLWTLLAEISREANFAYRWLGIPLAFGAAVWLIMKMPRKPDTEQLMVAAILSAGTIPILLPLMHERFFMLADILAFLFALAFPTKRNIALAIIVQIASAWPVLTWQFRLQPTHLIAPPLMAGALWIFWSILRNDGQRNDQYPVGHLRPTVP